jgi:hypothetical protein
MPHEFGGAANQKMILLLAIAGLGVLLLAQAAYMEVFSYPVTTRGIQNGISYANITYVDPLYNLFPVLVVGGISLSAYGFWKSKSIVGMHKRTVAAAFVIAAIATMLSLLRMTHDLTTGPNDYYYYGFPLPWVEHVFIDLPLSHDLWSLTPFVIDDVLFWAAVAYLGLWFGSRVRRRPH